MLVIPLTEAIVDDNFLRKGAVILLLPLLGILVVLVVAELLEALPQLWCVGLRHLFTRRACFVSWSDVSHCDQAFLH